MPLFMLQEEDDPRPLRWAIAGAIAFHLVLFMVTFPVAKKTFTSGAREQKAFVLQQVRFQPPQPQTVKARPTRKSRKVPIPDPTPDEPEPLLEEDYEVPEIVDTLADIGDALSIPDAPPSPGLPGILEIRGDVVPPRKLFAPQPGYTEEARQARVQGVVIMQAVIDVLGNVTDVSVLKGLPSGLADRAVETVLSWRFDPATLEGEPVPVYYNFTVNFTLQ